MLEAALRPFVREPRPLQPPGQMIGGEPQAVLLGQPVGQLRGRPGPLALLHRLLESGDERGREAGRLPHVRLIRQGLEAPGEELLDPIADPLVAEAEMDGDLRDAPAGVGQADHLQAVAGAGHDFGCAGAPLQLGALRFRQVDSIQRECLRTRLTPILAQLLAPFP